MAWLELKIALTQQDPAALERSLEEHSALAITLTDAGDQPLLEPGVGETPLWRDVTVTALFDKDTEQAPIERSVAATLGVNNACHWTVLEDRAWEREWLARFSPQQFGRNLWVIPGGMDPVAPAAANVELDPGLAFGTGDHETTAMCLEWLGDRPSLQRLRVLDYGCGSGILAIAALKLGARTAVALDNDPQALQATRDNALRNGVSDQLTILAADAPLDDSFDIVMANILAGPLIALAPRIAACVSPGGNLVLSGILAEQMDDVENAYRDTITWGPRAQRGDWARLHGQRRDSA